MWSPSNASSERLRLVAEEIEASGRWISFLTPQEHQLFLVAVRHSPETWDSFLKGLIPCQLRYPNTEEDSALMVDVDAVNLAFKVRYMLFESQVDAIYSPGIEPFGSQVNEGEKSDTSTAEAPKKGGAANDEDEDYDDDDEEDQEQGPSGVLPLIVIDTKHEDAEPSSMAKTQVIQRSLKRYDTFETDGDQVKRFLRLKETDEGNTEVNGSGAKPSTNGADPAGITGNLAEMQNISSFAKAAQFGSANLCLKHLLTTIDAHRHEMQVTDVELRNLISDVRKNRSKWANEDRIGQEELYEACERVVQELRGYTEHSTAFLNKVSKREAPNYYDVIKNPMDLSTVMRKIRSLQYNSKSEFVADLNLIWSNCLLYNSDPAHYLRKHAIAMRQKTQALTPLIPDVRIRSRAEVEAEAEEEERLARESSKRRRDSQSDSGKHHQKRRGVAVDGGLVKDEATETGENVTDGEPTGETPGGTPAGVPAEASTKTPADGTSTYGTPNDGNTPATGTPATGTPATSTPATGTPAVGTPASATPADSRANTPAPGTATHNAADTATGVDSDKDVSMAQDESSDDERSYPVDEEDYSAADVESTVWNSVSRHARLACITMRQGLFSNNKLQMDAEITPRTPSAMLNFERALNGEELATQFSGMSLLSNDSHDDDPFMVEYEVNAGLPPNPEGDSSSWLQAAVPKLADLPPSHYVPQGELNPLIMQNLNEMQKIRRLCAKILYIKDLQGGQTDFGAMMPGPGNETLASNVIASGAYSGGNAGGSGGIGAGGGAGGSTSEYRDIKDPEEDISSRLPGAASIDRTAAISGMRRAAAKLAMASGFEAAQTSAMDCLGGVAGDFLQKLGSLLMSNLEAPNSTASFASILKGSLEGVGVERLSQLTNYLGDDVLRQGRRLATFRSRLNSTLVEILRPEVERYQDEQFNDNSDQFVLGQFSNELGDDYFGFRELGIDKELGVADLTIPFHLLHQRIADSHSGVARNGTVSELDMPVPEYPPLLPKDIPGLPSFVRPQFENIFQKYAASKPPSQQQVTTSASADNNDNSTGSSGSGDAAGDGSDEASTNNYIAQITSQVTLARAKVPASGKLAVRKKKFDHAFVLPKKEASPEPGLSADGSGENQDPNADDEKENESLDQSIDQLLSQPLDADTKKNDTTSSSAPQTSEGASHDVDMQFGEGDPSAYGFDDSLPQNGGLNENNDEEDEDDEDEEEDPAAGDDLMS